MRAVSVILSEVAIRSPVRELELLTYLPLDAQSVARILDSLVEDGHAIRSGHGVQWEGAPPGNEAVDVEGGEHLVAPGFVENLVRLRGDQDWCRKVRDQHRVVRAIATLGPQSDLTLLAEHADLPPPRVRATLGDFEAEHFLQTSPHEDMLTIIAPDLDYPPERFERNEHLLCDVEARVVPLHRGWWIVLGIASVMLIVFIATGLVAVTG